ncbi:hypothetical protein EV182_003322, partial [Spiromyces aspiralis]
MMDFSDNHDDDDDIFNEQPPSVAQVVDVGGDHQRQLEHSLDASLGGSHAGIEYGASAMDDGELSMEELSEDIRQLRQVRLAITKINEGLENVRQQTRYFNSNMSQTSQLLDTWIDIISQVVHTHEFLSDDGWQGGTMDELRVNELKEMQRQREFEEQRRLEQERLQAEQEARARAIAAAEAAARPPLHPTASTESSRRILRGSVRGRRPPPDQPNNKRIYVGNLDSAVDEYTVLKLFETFGRIASLELAFHKTGPNKGLFRGFCFVEFDEAEHAVRAIQEMNGRRLRGRRIVVAPSTAV